MPLASAFARLAPRLAFSPLRICFAKMRIKLEETTLNMLIGSVLAVFCIPALLPGQSYFEGFGEFLVFKSSLRAGVFGLLAILLSVLLFILPYFVRTIYRINYRINTLEQDSLVRASDKVSYRKRKRYDKGYKSIR